ncbi:MAG TPA: hypothetical protein VND99_04250 [Candidatus Acidoferrales bacterium]|nr:hypothetical protein [Candidatus Acidoferrales bacterium]
MSIDDGEGLPIPIGDPHHTKEEPPVTEDTKRDLVKVLDDWCTIAGNPLPSLIAGIDNGKDVRYVPLSAVEDRIPLEIEVFNMPEGTSDNPNLRWAVVLDDNTGLLRQFFVNEIPDGLDLEYHERKHEEADQLDVELAVMTEDGAFFDEKYTEGQAKQQQDREQDRARTSDTKVKKLIGVLRSAEKREMSEE